MAKISVYKEYLLSYRELHRVLNYNETTGIFTWRVQLSSRGICGAVAGYKDTYIVISIHGVKYLGHRLAWLYVYGEWPVQILDHKDTIKHNNWISNLREVTYSENAQNISTVCATNTTGYTGVIPYYGKYKAQIYINGKKKYLGLHNSVKDAAEAYGAAKAIFHTM